MLSPSLLSVGADVRASGNGENDAGEGRGERDDRELHSGGRQRVRAEVGARGAVNARWLGDGPRMVRDVFSKARENAPCIIFIDEVALGRAFQVDRRGGAEAERLDGRRPRGAENSDGTADADGRIRPDHQRESDHGHQSPRNARPCADAAGETRPQSGVPAARPPAEAAGLPGLHCEDEFER